MTGHKAPACAACSHLEGDHKTGRTAFPHPVRSGVCLVNGCECREYTPAAEQDQEKAA